MIYAESAQENLRSGLIRGKNKMYNELKNDFEGCVEDIIVDMVKQNFRELISDIKDSKDVRLELKRKMIFSMLEVVQEMLLELGVKDE